MSIKKRRRLLASMYVIAVAMVSVASTMTAVSIETEKNVEVLAAPPDNNEIVIESHTENVPQEKEANEESVKKIIANCSAYTAEPEENGGDGSGMTASGKIAQEGRTIAMDDVPLGTRVRINGHEYIVEDRFGGGYTNRIDVFFNSKQEALKFGRQYLEVEILG